MIFNEFKLNRQTLDGIVSRGLVHPTPVQEKVIPLVLAGHDVLGIAPTGTGKTAAYLIPLIMKLRYPQEDPPRVLVLVPTRELAIQVGNEFGKLAKFTNLRGLSVYGGKGIKPQIESLNAGTDLLISTPGRFLDLYATGDLIVKKIKTLVLDEADRILDMGFIPQIRNILEVIPIKGRQNLLFSATFPVKVEKLSEEFLEFPVKIEVKPQATPAETIHQIAYKVPNLKTKISLLESILKDRERYNRVIIFTKTKKNANDVHKFITRKIDKEAVVIHANKDQNSRINAINAFARGSVRILVSTDVTARGIDISKVSHVVNFDVPVNYEDYIHRIGRTGRAEQTGTAIIFLTPPDELHMEQVRKLSRFKLDFKSLPPDVVNFPTEKQEMLEQAQALDRLRKKLDPEFKGAFHERKRKNRFKSGRRK